MASPADAPRRVVIRASRETLALVIGACALTLVIAYGLRLAPTVSLYVNHFNAPALAMYHRLGMRQIATLATVLL